MKTAQIASTRDDLVPDQVRMAVDKLCYSRYIPYSLINYVVGGLCLLSLCHSS